MSSRFRMRQSYTTWVLMSGFCFMQLYVRRRFFAPPKRTSQYYDLVTSEVRAESQVLVPCNTLSMISLVQDQYAKHRMVSPCMLPLHCTALVNVCKSLMAFLSALILTSKDTFVTHVDSTMAQPAALHTDNTCRLACPHFLRCALLDS